MNENLKKLVSVSVCAICAMYVKTALAGALTEPYRVNSYISGDQMPVQNAVGANGDSLLLWQDNALGTSFMKRYDANGQPLSGEVDVGKGTDRAAIDAQGNFALLRKSADGKSVLLRLFNRSGTARTPEIRVNDTVGSSAQTSYVAMNAQGEVIVYWMMYTPSLSTEWISYTKAFSATGTSLGWETRLATGFDFHSVVDAQGNQLSTWTEKNAQDGAYDVFVAWRDKFGYPLTNKLRVNSFVPGHQNASKIAMARDGSFVVVWNSSGQEGGCSVYGQRFAANGARIGGEFRINSTVIGGRNDGVNIGMLDDGRFVTTWYSDNRWDYPSSLPAIHVRQYRADGTPLGVETQVNTDSNALPFIPHLAFAKNGLYSVTWREYNRTAGNYDVFARRYAID